MKPVILAAACVAALATAGGAQAETWIYFPEPGGALAYEPDNRQNDLAQGLAAGDALTFFFVQRAVGAQAYSFTNQQLQFQCRGTQYRILGLAYFDPNGDVVAEGDPTDWLPVQDGTPISVFRHLICTDDKPPTAKTVASRPDLMAALRALPPTALLAGKKSAPSAADLASQSITLPASQAATGRGPGN